MLLLLDKNFDSKEFRAFLHELGFFLTAEAFVEFLQFHAEVRKGLPILTEALSEDGNGRFLFFRHVFVCSL